jgi:hypothetical protein
VQEAVHCLCCSLAWKAEQKVEGAGICGVGGLWCFSVSFCLYFKVE